MSFAPGLPPPTLVGTWEIPAGDRGTAATIRAMSALARGDASAGASLTVRMAGSMVLAGPGVAARIRAFLAGRVRFVPDPPGVELVRTPDRMLREVGAVGYTGGDCDDIATLGAGLGMAAGLRARFVTVAMRPGGPFVHVWAELLEGGRWVELDTSREAQGVPPDWRPGRRRNWSI